MKVQTIYVKMIQVILFCFILGFFSPVITKAATNVTQVDFGDVAVGSSVSRIVEVTNLDNTQGIYVIFALSAGYYGFSVDSQGVYIDPGQTANIDVYFSPLSSGSYSDTLVIYYGREGIGSVELTGNATEVTVKASEQIDIQDVLDYFDQSVDADRLEGIGKGKSADNRLKALRNMIVAAASMIENGLNEEACGQLKVVNKKIDDQMTGDPGKFAGGDAAPEIMDMIQKVIAALS